MSYLSFLADSAETTPGDHAAISNAGTLR